MIVCAIYNHHNEKFANNDGYVYINNNEIAVNNNKKYKIGIMAIFKNEEKYMEEWLIHHIKQGINHFYLYDNDGDIDKYYYLERYGDFITLIDWTDKKNNGRQTIQKQAYYDCVHKYSKECQFLGMLDIDEFMVPTKDDISIGSYVRNLKSEWDNIKAFKIQRYNFGSDMKLTKPKGDVMDNYKTKEKICSSFKALANTDFIDKSITSYVHDFNYIKNKKGKVYNEYLKYNVDFVGHPLGCKKTAINEIPIVINHYYTKSYEEYLERCKLWNNGGINPIGHRKNCEQTFKQKDVSQIK